MKTINASHRRSGFSLIELLTVVGVIGLVAAIVVPHMGKLTGAADLAKDRRNAQTILLAYSTGAAAGVVWPEGDVATQVAAVVAGRKPSGGVFAERMFRAELMADQVSNTYPFIGVRTNGELFFDPKGQQNASGN